VAEAGWALATGGYGGVMEAASRGAASAGGQAVGVLCKVFGSVGNRHLTRRIVTPDLYMRLRQLIDLGDGYVALPGSTGTLAELALVWELMNKRLLPLRPLVCLGSYWRPVVTMFASELTHDPRIAARGLPDRKGELITLADSPGAVIEALRRAWA
jgi:uncharacterized protein (TIGR00730 family)